MVLCERERQTRLSRELVARARAGRGQVLVLEGPLAAGRSAMLEAVIGEAQLSGFRVARAACLAAEQNIPGGVLSQLVYSFPTGSGPEGAPNPAADDFCLWALRHAAEQPLVVAVDDVHHADAASLFSLRYLARRLTAARVLFVATVVVDALGSRSAFSDELAGVPYLHRMGLELLSPAGSGALLRQLLPAAMVTERLIEDYYLFSGGSPVLLRALAEDWQRSGPEAISEDGYGAVVVRLVQEVHADGLRVGRAMAVLGSHHTPRRIARLAGLDDDSGIRVVTSVLTALRACGVMGVAGFAHPVGRAAVLNTVVGQDRVRLNHRAARLLYDSGEQVEAVACHFVRAGRRVEPWGVPVLVEAADRDLLEENNDPAIQLLDLALVSAGGGGEHAAILDRLTAARWRLSPASAAAHLRSLVTMAKAGYLEPGAAIALVGRLLWHGRTSEAADLLEILTSTNGGAEVPRELRELDLWLAYSHPRLARRAARGHRAGTPRSSPSLSSPPSAFFPPSPPSPPPPTPCGEVVRGDEAAVMRIGADFWLATAAELSAHLTRISRPAGTEWIEQILRNVWHRGSTFWGQEATSLALTALLDAGLAGDVLDWCATLTTRSSARRSPTGFARLRALTAEAHLRLGDLPGALTGAQDALATLPAHAWGVAVGEPIATLMTAAVRAGHVDEAVQALAVPVPEAIFSSRYGLRYLYARGLFHLATERAHPALSDFLACGDLARTLCLDAAAVVPWRIGAARAWLELGNTERARGLARDQLTRPEAAHGVHRASALRALAAVTEPTRRAPMLLEAVELLEACGDQYEQAVVLVDLGQTYSAVGETRRARTTLRRARHLATLCGARPLADSLLAVAENVDAEQPRVSEEALTDSERRVAHLAVLGYTNREIAAKLYVTASTVEQHLTRIYRKLQVKRRKDLPASLGTTGASAAARTVQVAAGRRSAS